jgi:hypothetical protein
MVESDYDDDYTEEQKYKLYCINYRFDAITDRPLKILKILNMQCKEEIENYKKKIDIDNKYVLQVLEENKMKFCDFVFRDIKHKTI